MTHRKCPVSLLYLPLLTTFGALLAAAPATSQSTAVPPEVARLLTESHLRLSSDESSASTRFQLRLTLTVTKANGEKDSSICVVARNGDRCAVLVVTPDGRPYAYMTDGMILMFDPDHPGSLLISNAGMPGAVFKTDPKTDHLQAFAYSSIKNKQPTIDLDPGTFLTRFLAKASHVDFDAKNQTLSLQDEKAIVVAHFSPFGKKGEFGLIDMTIKGQTGTFIRLDEIKIDADPTLRLDATPQLIAKSGFTSALLDLKEGSGLALEIPATFGKSPAEQASAKKLQELLLPTAGTTPQELKGNSTNP